MDVAGSELLPQFQPQRISVAGFYMNLQRRYIFDKPLASLLRERMSICAVAKPSSESADCTILFEYRASQREQQHLLQVGGVISFSNGLHVPQESGCCCLLSEFWPTGQISWALSHNCGHTTLLICLSQFCSSHSTTLLKTKTEQGIGRTSLTVQGLPETSFGAC